MRQNRREAMRAPNLPCEALKVVSMSKIHRVLNVHCQCPRPAPANTRLGRAVRRRGDYGVGLKIVTCQMLGFIVSSAGSAP